MDYQLYGTQPTYIDEMMQLRNALAEKDREIAELKECKSIMLGTGTDQEAVIHKERIKRWIPRNLKDDGMIGGHDIPAYVLDVTPYILLSDHEYAMAKMNRAYHALMGQAIEFAQYLDTAFWPGNNAVEKAQSFLASHKVREWRKQEGERGTAS